MKEILALKNYKLRVVDVKSANEPILSLSNFEYFVVGGTLRAKVTVVHACLTG